MLVRGYHHVTHNVSRSNVELARRFYGGILGLAEIPAVEDPTGQRLIWYELGSHQLHLVIRDESDAPSSRHIALFVDDFDLLIAELRKHEIRMDRFSGHDSWGSRRDGTRYTFCYDPDGNRIELVESKN